MPHTPHTHTAYTSQAMASLDQGGVKACPMPVRRPRQASSIMESSSQVEGVMMAKGVNATRVSTTAVPAAAGASPTTTTTTATTMSTPSAASAPAAQVSREGDGWHGPARHPPLVTQAHPNKHTNQAFIHPLPSPCPSSPSTPTPSSVPRATPSWDKIASSMLWPAD